jgi:hypothetical protein
MRRAFAGAALVLALVVPARADDELQPGPALLDRPTLLSLGVQLLIAGDDDHDADGPVDEIITPQGTTRGVPAEPVAPTPVPVASTGALSTARSNAQPGHVITLADGTYTGAFAIFAGGTATNPIVIRGTSTDGTILDGNGCGSCNVLEIHGSHVHLERLTLQHAGLAVASARRRARSLVTRRRTRDACAGSSEARHAALPRASPAR